MSVAEQQDITNDEIDYKAFYEANLEKVNSFDAVLAKKDELYKENKRIKAEKEAAANEVKKIAEQKELETGEFEQLYKKRDEDYKNVLAQFKNERINTASLRIANELADGDNVGLLSEFISRDLQKNADDYGVLSTDVLTDIRNEFANNARYKSLLRANKAVGGSAPGNSSSRNVTNNIMKRTDFEGLDSVKKMDAIKKGVQIID